MGWWSRPSIGPAQGPHPVRSMPPPWRTVRAPARGGGCRARAAGEDSGPSTAPGSCHSPVRHTARWIPPSPLAHWLLKRCQSPEHPQASQSTGWHSVLCLLMLCPSEHLPVTHLTLQPCGSLVLALTHLSPQALFLYIPVLFLFPYNLQVGKGAEGKLPLYFWAGTCPLPA